MIENSMSAGIHPIRCPFCEVYELKRLSDGSARCTSCRGTLDATVLSTLLVIDRQPRAVDDESAPAGQPASSGQFGISRP
jgi:hypothetical protein